jgi:hypothetical protein
MSWVVWRCIFRQGLSVRFAKIQGQLEIWNTNRSPCWPFNIYPELAGFIRYVSGGPATTSVGGDLLWPHEPGWPSLFDVTMHR